MSQFATFRVGDHHFAFDILGIREILRVFDITPVPRADKHIRGLINLRGQIVTILDLAVRLGRPSLPIIDTSHIVILKAGAEAGMEARSQGLLGLLVDAIGDVVSADDSLADAPPANITEDGERFVSGVLKTEAGLLVLLNRRELLSNG